MVRDVVLAESLDRFCDQEDTEGLNVEPSPASTSSRSPEGDITHIGLKGRMIALFLKDIGRDEAPETPQSRREDNRLKISVT